MVDNKVLIEAVADIERKEWASLVSIRFSLGEENTRTEAGRYGRT